MKKIYFILAGILLLSGCFKDERDNFMAPDAFGINASDVLQEASAHTGSYILGISKSGKGKTSGTVTFAFDALALDAYNEENGTDYKAVLPSLVYFDQNSLSFNADDVTKSITLRWDAEPMSQYIAQDTRYVIPVRIQSQDLEVNKGRDLILLHVNRSAISVKQPNVSRTIERKSVEADADGNVPQLKEIITLDLALTPVIKQTGLSFPVSIDNSLIDEFNAKSDVVYSQAPDGLVTILDGRAAIGEGNQGGNFRVQLDKEVLLNNGKYEDFPPYVIPVRVEREGIQATKDGEEFQLQGLSYGNMVSYIVVEPAAKGIKSISRVWGHYSAGSAWYSFLDGFSASADRTLAMDDEYVYISHSSNQGGIYALSVSGGDFVKKLDVTPALSTGCTLTVSCVRTVPNKNGKDVLTFCTLKEDSEQHLYVYAYTNGTDAAPVQILDFSVDNKGGVADWRRYGDRYTVEGTWQNGTLWFQTWHDGATAKTIGFTIVNGSITNPQDPIDYYVANPPAGIKDVVFYPGGRQAFMTGSIDATLYSPGAAGPNGWIQWNPVETLSDLKYSFGYNFFNFHDSNFIAYMKLEGENAVRGSLVVIDDETGTPAGLTSQLKAMTNLREFPIQDADDPQAKSSVASSHSVGDCTVHEVNGNTYIAVLQQGVGVSLFQLQ